jgi:hypothetical protein
MNRINDVSRAYDETLTWLISKFAAITAGTLVLDERCRCEEAHAGPQAYRPHLDHH